MPPTAADAPRASQEPRNGQLLTLDLDQVAEPLREILGSLTATLTNDIGLLMNATAGLEPDETVAILAQALPLMAAPVCAAATDFTLEWYEALAPAAGYRPDPPANHGMPAPEQLAQTAGWAVRGRGDGTPADRLTGAATRWVNDAARDTVSHNASREGAMYIRHAAAGACAFCRLGASRGPIFKSAASAIRGHDNCQCVAVPHRPGTRLVLPTRYQEWASQYDEATAALQAEGRPVDLRNVLMLMRASDGGLSQK